MQPGTEAPANKPDLARYTISPTHELLQLMEFHLYLSKVQRTTEKILAKAGGQQEKRVVFLCKKHALCEGVFQGICFEIYSVWAVVHGQLYYNGDPEHCRGDNLYS